MPVVRRGAESRAVDDFLGSAAGPSALVIDGEPGIGKTTLFVAALKQAAEQGFRVLSACPAAAESVLAYAALADLLAGVDDAVLETLPAPQRLAVDRVLLRADSVSGATDQRAVGAALLSVLLRLAEQAPVLVAIDDLQWLDSSTVTAVAFAVRRLPARAQVLATMRADPDSVSATAWLRLPRPDAIRRLRVAPMSLGGLHAVIRERLGRSIPRPTMVRIHEIAGGNPFYALELARTLGSGMNAEAPLPDSLSELVRARIGNLGAGVDEVLLAAASLASPTVELIARATDSDSERVVGLLAAAECQGIVGFDGHRLRFDHPLLARAVYSAATPARRRDMHRRLADIVEEPELQARHLAKGVAWADEHTLQRLDGAAELARIRGAPTAAAELLDLAVSLGGDTPQRRILTAGHHYNAGDFARARALLEQLTATIQPGPLRARALGLLGVMETLEGSITEAASLLRRALTEAADDLALRAQILVPLSFAIWNVGRRAEAVPMIDDAVTAATRSGQPHLLSQALGMRSLVCFLQGRGVDRAGVQRAVELEDKQVATAVVCRPAMHHAMLLAFAGQLEQAREEMHAIGRECGERGEESERVFIAFHSVLIEIWRGNFAEATSIADDAMERAHLLDGGLPHAVALTMRNALAAYAGREAEVRRDTDRARTAMEASGSFLLAAWPITILGFLEVSLGNYEAALTALEPLQKTLDPDATEIFVAPFLPDAIDALIHLHRFSEAEPLVEALEGNGHRLDRPWMLATGARCRSMLSAARGDVEAALVTAQDAMAQHDRLSMPFERARTQLLLGKLRRRHRQREAAMTTLGEALNAFEAMGTRLWAEQARAELSRVSIGRGGTGGLTPSEKRVADLAASGMTNRDVAAALFISPKTVEVNLARIYRKLGIHSRAELGRVMDRFER